MKEESLLLLSDLQKLINQVVLIDYTIIILGGDSMFPTINKKETGVNLRRIMDMRGVKPKDIQEYLGFGCVQSVYRWLDGVSMPTVDNANNIYTRVMDSNTPKNKTAEILHIEYLWKKRFRLLMAPLEQAFYFC